jgi:urease accessory protein
MWSPWAVGLWGAFLGAPAIWILAVVFPLVTAVGGVFGVLGVPMPAVETGIALSGVILELDGSFCRKALLKIAGAIVGIFAIFHGHAHGSELPEAVSVITMRQALSSRLGCCTSVELQSACSHAGLGERSR